MHINLEKDMVLNIETKFHRVVIKVIRLKDGTTSKLVFVHEQRAMTRVLFHEKMAIQVTKNVKTRN